MRKTYCLDQQKDWDESLLFFIFDAQETRQESLGFELAFECFVRGSLMLVKKFMQDTPNPVNLTDYVENFRKRITKYNQIVKKNLWLTQDRMKEHHDKNNVKQEIAVGDEVLVLLPLKAKFPESYTILRKLVKSEIGDHSRGWPEGSLFDSYYTKM